MKRIIFLVVASMLFLVNTTHGLVSGGGGGGGGPGGGGGTSEASGSISTGISTGLNLSIPCNPATVANGSVNAQNCSITCNGGFQLSGVSCNAISSGGGGGGGGGSSADYCPTGDLSGSSYDGKCTAPLTGSGSTSSGATVNWSGSTNTGTGNGNSSTTTGNGSTSTGTTTNSGQVIVPIATDIADNWAKEYISVLIKRGIVQNAKEFRPNDSLSRAEFLKIVGNSAGWDVQSASGVTLPFKDLSTVPWASPYLRYAISNKIVSSANEFRPNDNISRAEVAKILSVSLKLRTSGYVGVFSDVPKSNSLSLYVESMKAEKIFEWQLTLGKLIFRPSDHITRAEIAKVVVNAFKLK